MINNDLWDDHGKVFRVIEMSFVPKSTGVLFKLEHDGIVITRTIPANQVEWIDESDVSIQ